MIINSTIKVEVKNIYGETRVYPMCDKSKMFASIAGTITLTNHTLSKVEALGYTIENVTKALSWK